MSTTSSPRRNSSELDKSDTNTTQRDAAFITEKPLTSTTTTTTQRPLIPASTPHELREEDCHQVLGYAWISSRKWSILTVIFAAQLSMNLNAAIFGSAIPGLIETFGARELVVRNGGMLGFLVAYAFGCELWAPWSEELGRKKVLQWSLGLVNLWAACAGLVVYFAPANGIGAVILFRILGGFSSAGGSVTLAVVADMFKSNDHQYALAYIVQSSVSGSVIGAIVGGFVQQYLPVHYNFWIQVIFGVIVQLAHLVLVPETRSSVLCTREAKRQRAADPGCNIYSTDELQPELHKVTLKQACRLWIRPFHMFVTEPIVLFLSLLSGFGDAFIFSCIESFVPVYKLWDFTPSQIGLAFIPILIGYIIAHAIWVVFIKWDMKKRARNPDLAPESRLVYLLWVVWLLPIGLAILAWPGSWGPVYDIPWVVPMIASACIGIANFAIYGATIDYMVEAYKEYSASATGGNGFSRDFLAGIASLYTHPLYYSLSGGNFEKYHLSLGTTVMLGLACVFVIPVFIFWRYGQWFRQRSKFALKIGETAAVREEHIQQQRRRSSITV